MLKMSTARPPNRRTPRVSELAVWRAAAQLRSQYPETPWLEAAHRASQVGVGQQPVRVPARGRDDVVVLLTQGVDPGPRVGDELRVAVEEASGPVQRLGEGPDEAGGSRHLGTAGRRRGPVP